jgi:hypothetical protein
MGSAPLRTPETIRETPNSQPQILRKFQISNHKSSIVLKEVGLRISLELRFLTGSGLTFGRFGVRPHNSDNSRRFGRFGVRPDILTILTFPQFTLVVEERLPSRDIQFLSSFLT